MATGKLNPDLALGPQTSRGKRLTKKELHPWRIIGNLIFIFPTKGAKK